MNTVLEYLKNRLDDTKKKYEENKVVTLVALGVVAAGVGIFVYRKLKKKHESNRSIHMENEWRKNTGTPLGESSPSYNQ